MGDSLRETAEMDGNFPEAERGITAKSVGWQSGAAPSFDSPQISMHDLSRQAQFEKKWSKTHLLMDRDELWLSVAGRCNPTSCDRLCDRISYNTKTTQTAFEAGSPSTAPSIDFTPQPQPRPPTISCFRS